MFHVRWMLVGITVLATGTALAGVIAASLGGLVETTDGQPLGSAQVIVEPLDGGPPLVAYTNPQGLFRISHVASRAFLLRANAPGFQPRGIAIDIEKGGPTTRLQLVPVATESTVKAVTFSSGPQNSGWGADWSSLYTLCGTAEPGFRIRNHSFRLAGDRSCGAWAECTPIEQGDTKVCWGFRLQGHSERVLFNDAVKSSEGLLTVTIESTRAATRPYVTVYILCSTRTERAATGLRSALVAQGWRVADLQRLDADFSSRIVTAGETNSDAGREVAQAVQVTREHLAKAEAGLAALPLVPRSEFEVPPGILEIWLGRDPRLLRKQ